MTPTLSIIIPAWNEEKYIARTIESLRQAGKVYEQQRGGTVEIIVVDNNSSDRTGAIAREHGALVVHEPVNNIGKARNSGARLRSSPPGRCAPTLPTRGRENALARSLKIEYAGAG